MGRPPQSHIRERLLEACTDYSLEAGLPDGIGPVAQAVGTSSRMLLYHFGSKHELQRAILQRARQRQIDLFSDLLLSRDGESYASTLARAWMVMSGPDAAPYLRMFGQLRENAEQRIWPGFRRLATEDWLPPLEAGLGRDAPPGAATLVLAVIRGLLMDLDATGDRPRADRAFKAFLESLAIDAFGGSGGWAFSLDRA